MRCLGCVIMKCRDCDKLEPRGCGKTCCAVDGEVIRDFDTQCTKEIIKDDIQVNK